MFDYLLCGINLICHFDNIRYQVQRPKYPEDVAIICQYFEEQKSELPEYCKWKSETFKPRRRSEF